MNKLRIPLPKQTGKIMDDAKAYKRQRDKEIHVEWEINCSKCGIFTQIQDNKPKKCPYCGNYSAGISEI